jgi:hypothetical protein
VTTEDRCPQCGNFRRAAWAAARDAALACTCAAAIILPQLPSHYSPPHPHAVSAASLVGWYADAHDDPPQGGSLPDPFTPEITTSGTTPTTNWGLGRSGGAGGLR